MSLPKVDNSLRGFYAPENGTFILTILALDLTSSKKILWQNKTYKHKRITYSNINMKCTNIFSISLQTFN